MKQHYPLLIKYALFVALVMNVCLPVRYWLETTHTFTIEASNPQVLEPIILESRTIRYSNEKTIKGGVVEEVKEVEVHETPSTQKQEIKDYIYEVFGKDGDVAYAVAMCESRLDPNAVNDKNYLYGGKGTDWGVFQINDYWQRNRGDIANLTWKENVEIAKNIYDDRGNFEAWYCYTWGIYKQFLN